MRAVQEKGYIAQGWLVVALALVFGAGLAAVHAGLQPRIEANRLQDTLGQVPALVPGAERGVAVEVGGRTVYEALDAADARVGWVLPAGGQGFADRIEILVGLNRGADTITGLSILEQKETPGLGNRIADPDWRAGFEGRPVGPRLRLVRHTAEQEDEIEAITGATISSQSVVDILNTAARAAAPDLRAAPEPAP